MVKVFMVHSHDGIIDIVDYFDENGNLQKADFSKLQMSSENVDYEKLAIMIQPYEDDKKRKSS